jgi:hypothetical protein
MSYLADYLHYSSGAETPDEFLYWGGLSILGHVLGNKVWVTHGDHFRFYPNLYIALVGDAGAGKNTALSTNIDIMTDDFPELLVSSSIQSREDIAYQMADDTKGLTVWQDHLGMLHEYRPFYILNNELASFLSVDKLKMVEFLTEVFDGKRFSTGFKGDRKDNPIRKQFFKNPHVSLIAGAVPTWFMSSLKMDLFSGGLGRRLIIVYGQRTKIIPFPTRPPGAKEAFARVKAHLREAATFKGEINRTASANKWWEEWYIAHRKQRNPDPILSQFHETKGMQLLKVATGLHMCNFGQPGFKPDIMNEEPLIIAGKLLDDLEPNIIKLTSGIGRNELAGVGAEMLEFISRLGGLVSEVMLRKHFYRYLKNPEFMDIQQHYMDIGELFIVQNPKDGKKYYFTKEGFQQYELKKKEKNNETAS